MEWGIKKIERNKRGEKKREREKERERESKKGNRGDRESKKREQGRERKKKKERKRSAGVRVGVWRRSRTKIIMVKEKNRWGKEVNLHEKDTKKIWNL